MVLSGTVMATTPRKDGPKGRVSEPAGAEPAHFPPRNSSCCSRVVTVGQDAPAASLTSSLPVFLTQGQLIFEAPRQP